MTTITAAQDSDVDRLAQLWYDGWRDAHLIILPEALTRLRTLESFRDRLKAALTDVRVAVADAGLAGFVMLKGATRSTSSTSPPKRAAPAWPAH